jgi:8-oxo-dGTP pyrophosphatase MutT (NUDIX family)
MEAPAPPRPAATVIVARDRPGGGFEVLMLMRNLKSDFVGGAYVFPGGAVDPEDATDAAARRCVGLDDGVASTVLGLEAGGLAYWVACARELFEEAGLLLATKEGGAPLDAGDAALAARLVEHRREVNDGTRRFLDVLAAESLVLDGAALSYFAHWITPVGPPRRYDTRFFVAAAPEGQVPVHDDKELVANTWVTPGEALERHRRGDMQLILPTIKNLEAIDRFGSAADLLDAAGDAVSVPTIEPRIVADGSGVRILLPGDDGFDDTSLDDAPAGSVGNQVIDRASGRPRTP